MDIGRAPGGIKFKPVDPNFRPMPKPGKRNSFRLARSLLVLFLIFYNLCKPSFLIQGKKANILNFFACPLKTLLLESSFAAAGSWEDALCVIVMKCRSNAMSS